MNKRTILFFLFFIVSITINAQTFKAYLKAGDKAIQKKDYYAAMVYLKNALEINPDSYEVMYRYAEVARQYHGYDQAEEYYKKVALSENKDEFPLVNFWLGEVKKSKGEYAEALTYYKKYVDQGGNSDYIKKAKAQMESCRWAIDVTAIPDEIKVDRLNKRVNSPYSDFGALMKGDTLYYSSYKFSNRNDNHDPPRRQTRVLYSIRGAKGRALKNNFNDKKLHTAHNTFSRDGKRIYFTQCKFKGTVEITCELCYKEKDSRKRWKKKLVKLPAHINVKGFTATHPSVGLDQQTGKEVLYFASDRKGGKGKLDIWYTVIDGKKFSEPKNLEHVNTEGDDLTPFFHTPTQTLYFSSDGHQGLGGYDVFSSKKTPIEWKAPEHTGYPLNSSYHDLYYSISDDDNLVYLSSNRPGSFYLNKKNKTCCNDIYKVDLNPQKDEEIVDSLLIVIEEEEVPEEIIVEVEERDEPYPPVSVPQTTPKQPETLEDFLPLQLYYDNDEPDKRTRKSTTKKNYEETYHAYYSRKSEFIQNYTSPLNENDKYQAESDLNYFFENKIKKGYDHLFLFSQILLRRLNDGDQVEIFLKGFTSPRAKSDYNIYLAKRRISCVRNHFETYAGGVFKLYLRSGQLIISERSFGETTASQGISDDLNDQRNSIFSVGASEERRVEIVEIKRSK